MRKRRSVLDPLVHPERRDVRADPSQRGQTRYVQLRDRLPKVCTQGEFCTKAFDDQCNAARSRLEC
jgi:hypothetical protein